MRQTKGKQRTLHRKLLAAALGYARRHRWKVFPVRDKGPLKGSHGFKDASANADTIKRLFAQYPTANGVGVRNDSVRGPLVLDVDGSRGDKAVRKLALPPTRAAQSRPGRYHLYFNPPTDGALTVRRKLKIRPGLDLLGDGGYVVLPPSIHPETGKSYTWLGNGDALLEPFPDELADLLADERKLGSQNGGAPALPEVINEGQRDDLLTSLAGSMRRRGASPNAILEALRVENRERVDPPLSDKQLRKIATSIGKKAPARITGPLTTDTNADLFVRRFGSRTLYVDAEGKGRWLIWDGTRWKRDRRHIEHLVRKVTADLTAASDAESDREMATALAAFAKRLGRTARTRAAPAQPAQVAPNWRASPSILIARRTCSRSPTPRSTSAPASATSIARTITSRAPFPFRTTRRPPARRGERFCGRSCPTRRFAPFCNALSGIR